MASTPVFGGNVKFLIPRAEMAAHQRGMLRNLYCGTGPALSDDAVRGAILLRANALAKGYSAVRPLLLDRLIEMLNAYIVPIVPSYGSVGASGDLIPSAYVASVLLGEGRVVYRGQEMRATDALARRRAHDHRRRVASAQHLALPEFTILSAAV